MRHRLRLFTGNELETETCESRMSVRLGDIARALGDAGRSQRTWLDDFEDDEISVSPDLYDVLAAYIHLRPGA